MTEGARPVIDYGAAGARTGWGRRRRWCYAVGLALIGLGMGGAFRDLASFLMGAGGLLVGLALPVRD
jgi:hypothetical protein